jgi:cobalamin synthase
MLHLFLKRVLTALCGCLLLAGAAHAIDVTVTGSLDAGSPTFNRPTDRTGYPASANTALPYAVVPVRTGATGGSYTFTVGGSTEFDSFLALYSAFDPATPLANILVADDDGAGYPHARATVSNLSANTSYYLVITSFSNNANSVYPLYGNYALTLSGDLAGYAVSATASPAAGGSVSCSPSVVMQGGSSTCTATANVGYSFTGFSGDCSGATCTLSNVSSAKSVVANFSLNNYAISASANPVAGGSVSCTPNPVDYGSTATCTATANVGYSFVGFSGDCSGASCVLSNVTGAKNVTASFVLNTYAISTTANPVAGGTVSCTPNPVGHGGSSTCTATANAGYTFSGFSGDCSGATCTLAGVTSARSVTASFTVNTYAITATASPVAGGTVSCTPNPVSHGANATCTATPNANYSFGSFSGDCTGATCTLSNVTSAKSVTASFTLNSYTVTATASPVAGGTVSCTPNPVGHGSNSTCTVTANAGYTFSGFSGDCTGATCTLSNVTAAKSVTASFTQNTYAVTATASPVAGGTISCTPNPVTHGTNATCTATANVGYTFGNFSGDCTGATCTLSNVTSAKSVTASFTQNTYAVTATVSPVAGGTVNCTPNPVPHGGNATCTATANANYRLGSFSGDCTGATCTLSNVTSAKNVTANFIANTAPVASNVTLSGTAQVGSALTGAYTYTDAESDPQGVSTFRWMVDVQSTGASRVAVSGATAQTYTVGADVFGKYLFFCVTPVASAGVTTGVEVCSSASAVVAAAPVETPPPPLIPPLVINTPAGLVFVPPVLDMGGGAGPTVVSGVTTVLQQVLGNGLQFAGQNAQGAVVMNVPGGGNVVFMPLSVQTNDPRPNGLYPTGNGQYQIVSNGTALLVTPTVQNLGELVGLLPAGSGARMESNGVLTAEVGGQTYVVQPSVFVQLQVNPGGVPTLTLGADGLLRFTDAAGNSQTLYPAFREADAALRIVQSIDPNATLRIQLDGTAQVRLNGQDLVLVPDLILGGVPAGMEALYWWQESERRYRVRIQANWFNYQSQGFTAH